MPSTPIGNNHLKNKFQAKLNLPGGTLARRDRGTGEIRATLIVERSYVRVAKVWMIERIKELRPELEAP